MYILQLITSSISDFLGNKLTSDDLGDVLEAVLDASAQWYNLGLQLKVRTGTLDRIRTQFPDPNDQLREMLKAWLNTSDDPTWKTLTDSLRSRSVGASQLAGDPFNKPIGLIHSNSTPPSTKPWQWMMSS